MDKEEIIYCSFCGESHKDVLAMVAARDGGCFICDKCVDVARDVVGLVRAKKYEEFKATQ